MYTLRNNDKANYYLIFGKRSQKDEEVNKSEKLVWRLVERTNEDNWCLVGTGSSVEYLKSLHDISGSIQQFGLPNSGYRRCNDRNDGAFGSILVRKWANKELGKSFVMHFQTDNDLPSFTLLSSEEPVLGEYPWILVSTVKKPDKIAASCYRGRGNSSKIYKDFSISK